jgi:hypothetical protein
MQSPEHWSLSGAVPSSAPGLAQVADAIRTGAARWLLGPNGVKSVTSPAGVEVVPVWGAGCEPPSDIGEVGPIPLDEITDRVLDTLDARSVQVGLARRDAVRTVHPLRLRRAVLWQT